MLHFVPGSHMSHNVLYWELAIYPIVLLLSLASLSDLPVSDKSLVWSVAPSCCVLPGVKVAWSTKTVLEMQFEFIVAISCIRRIGTRDFLY